ncbi:sensor domain-containing protein [Actinoplanes sp. DH11]|uniref:sensor domain-containing protein n=1 Tax=Actinoplanes sp. DH11 TaxID=2857011 RepID=UPI001E61F9BE|nr:sensor domain-containing protein [Actinoplanes sp. DH11]
MTIDMTSRLGADTRYVLTGFPLALASVVVCVTGFSLGLSLAVLWVGVPVLIASMMMARGFAVSERARVATVLGAPVPEPEYRAGGPSLLSRLAAVLTDPQAWRDLAYAAVRWAPNTIAVTVVLTWWAGVVGGLSWGLWGWALPKDGTELPEMLGLGDDYLTVVALYAVLAMLFVASLPAVVRWAARFEARFAVSLLGPCAQGGLAGGSVDQRAQGGFAGGSYGPSAQGGFAGGSYGPSAQGGFAGGSGGGSVDPCAQGLGDVRVQEDLSPRRLVAATQREQM